METNRSGWLVAGVVTTTLVMLSVLCLLISVLLVSLLLLPGEDEPDTVESGTAAVDAVVLPTATPDVVVASGDAISPYPIEMIAAGRTLYRVNCASCHGNNTGEEVYQLIGKSLQDNLYIRSQDDDALVEFIKIGREVDDPVNVTGYAMPAKGGNPDLTDEDLYHIVSYLRTLTEGSQMASLPALPEASGAGDVAYQWTPVVAGLDSPLQLVGDGMGNLYAVEQAGYILRLNDDGTYETFLDLTTKVPDAVYHGGYTEQGVLGLAFHPNFERTGQFFVSYIDKNGDSVIARYHVMPEDFSRADPNSELVLVTADQPFEDHNGGNVAFGPDGHLYVAFGDGGRPAEPNYRSQDPASLMGKMLRLDITNDGYTIPADNPFLDDPQVPDEVWALGLRNPWRFSFDRATGDLYIGDVGQWIYEEINFQPADSPGGENYGWSAFEANHTYLDDATVYGGEVTMPVIEYAHDMGCSVTGGYVYRGQNLPELQGRYIYGDYCNGNIWTAWRDESGVWQSELFMTTEYVISSFGEDDDGELYLVDYKGEIYRLDAAPQDTVQGGD